MPPPGLTQAVCAFGVEVSLVTLPPSHSVCHIPLPHTFVSAATQERAVRRCLHCHGSCPLCAGSLFTVAHYSSPSHFADRSGSRSQPGCADGKNKSAVRLGSRMLSCPHKARKPQSVPAGQGHVAHKQMFPETLPSVASGTWLAPKASVSSDPTWVL